MVRDDYNNSKLAWFRFITPILITIAIFMIGESKAAINEKITSLTVTVSDIDNKLFKHLTNDELHTPRSLVLFKSEQDLINRLRTEQFNAINYQMKELKDILFESRKISNKNFKEASDIAESK